MRVRQRAKRRRCRERKPLLAPLSPPLRERPWLTPSSVALKRSANCPSMPRFGTASPELPGATANSLFVKDAGATGPYDKGTTSKGCFIKGGGGEVITPGAE